MPVWLEKFLLSLILKFIERAMDKALKEVKRAEENSAQTKEEYELGEKNAKKYRDAKTRAERIKAALDLLNSTPG